MDDRHDRSQRFRPGGKPLPLFESGRGQAPVTAAVEAFRARPAVAAGLKIPG